LFGSASVGAVRFYNLQSADIGFTNALREKFICTGRIAATKFNVFGLRRKQPTKCSQFIYVFGANHAFSFKQNDAAGEIVLLYKFVEGHCCKINVIIF
jgi:hypothetical protein